MNINKNKKENLQKNNKKNELKKIFFEYNENLNEIQSLLNIYINKYGTQNQIKKVKNFK